MGIAKQVISTKRLQIDKARANVVMVIAIASFVAVFSLVSARALWTKRSFQARVIGEKKTTLETLKANNAAAEQLVTSYKAFNDTPDNLIGGNPKGTGDRDGENATLVLDALPSEYDYPGLTSSMAKIINGSKLGDLDSFTGTDDEVAQSGQTDSSKPIEMPFSVAITTKEGAYKGVLTAFSRSIRPMTIDKISISSSGQAGELSLSIDGKTYYQPQKTLSITQKEVR